MSKRRQLLLIWTGLTVITFSGFYWLFGLAMPGAALPFSLGTTSIVTGGGITGWYLARVWFSVDRPPSNGIFAGLVAFVLIGFVMVAFLLNKMVGNTQLFDFASTVLLLFLVCTCLGAFASLIRVRIKSKLHTARAAAEQSKSELQLLQSQLSPHFLFNTLNNIYGLSISDHALVPELLLKLSDLLRYSVYEAKELFVPLNDELDYLRNYIEFEKIRIGHRLNIQCRFPGRLSTGIKIAPMLLIVFVENAFKHSRSTHENGISIDLNIEYTGDEIRFKIRNSCENVRLNSEFHSRHSGFGLDNVRKRLALLYPEKHVLEINASDHEYEVNLQLTSV
jgi:LytS/YehU family sensor histidine kinase